MNHKPGSLEESAQRVLLGEAADDIRDRAEKAFDSALKKLEDFVTAELQGEKDADLIIALNDVMSYLDTNSAMNDIAGDIAADIRYNEEQDD